MTDAHTQAVREKAESRFWPRVNRTDGCWLWTGPKANGYGRLYVGGKRWAMQAHRFAYELLVGPIPPGWQIDHLCRNPVCVNPSHMEPVTSRENTLRGVGPTAQNAKRTHCIHGHPFDAANTLLVHGHRDCRTCKRIQWMRRKRVSDLHHAAALAAMKEEPRA